MAPVYTLDPERFFLGNGCSKGHYWPGTTKSPRHLNNRNCFACRPNARKGREWLLRFVDLDASGLSNSFYIGKLCKRGHRWEGFERSLNLRHPKGSKQPGQGKCFECIRIDSIESKKQKTPSQGYTLNSNQPYNRRNIEILAQYIACDISHESGLVWIKSTCARNPVGSTAGFSDGKGKWSLVFMNTYMSAPRIILLLNGIAPPSEEKCWCVKRIDPNGPWNDCKNLTWCRRGETIKTKNEEARIALIRYTLGNDGPDLGSGRRLGRVCRFAHKWNGCDLGIQVLQGKKWKCQECCRARNEREQKSQTRKQRNKARYRANLEEERAKARKRMEKRNRTPEARIYNRQYSRARKVKVRGLTVFSLSSKQVLTRFAEFNNCCAYCGTDKSGTKSGVMTIDHVAAIDDNGFNAIGNILPACMTCNSSKQNKHIIDWYFEQPFFNELRWKKICKVLEWSKSSVGQLALL